MHTTLAALWTWSCGLKRRFESVPETNVNQDGADKYHYRQRNGACAAYPSSHEHNAKHQPKTRQPNRQPPYPEEIVLTLEWPWGMPDRHNTERLTFHSC